MNEKMAQNRKRWALWKKTTCRRCKLGNHSHHWYTNECGEHLDPDPIKVAVYGLQCRCTKDSR